MYDSLPPAFRGARVGLITNRGALDGASALVIDRIASSIIARPSTSPATPPASWRPA